MIYGFEVCSLKGYIESGYSQSQVLHNVKNRVNMWGAQENIRVVVLLLILMVIRVKKL
jgi:hypothetical protein